MIVWVLIFLLGMWLGVGFGVVCDFFGGFGVCYGLVTLVVFVGIVVGGFMVDGKDLDWFGVYGLRRAVLMERKYGLKVGLSVEEQRELDVINGELREMVGRYGGSGQREINDLMKGFYDEVRGGDGGDFDFGIRDVFESLDGSFREKCEGDPLFGAVVDSCRERLGLSRDINCVSGVGLKVRMALDGVLRVSGIEGAERREVRDVFVNYDFYRCHIVELLSRFQGICCCVDVCHFVLRQYVRFVCDGSLGEWGDEYWVPKCGSSDEWMGLVGSLGLLRVGKSCEYVSALDCLVKAYGG